MVRHGGRDYHGAKAMHWLALMSTRSDAFNRLVSVVFRRPGLSARLYPALKVGRLLALRLFGRQPIGGGAG